MWTDKRQSLICFLVMCKSSNILDQCYSDTGGDIKIYDSQDYVPWFYSVWYNWKKRPQSFLNLDNCGR